MDKLLQYVEGQARPVVGFALPFDGFGPLVTLVKFELVEHPPARFALGVGRLAKARARRSEKVVDIFYAFAH
jgi:hypothetical protein